MSATGCPEGILGPAPRCCGRVKHNLWETSEELAFASETMPYEKKLKLKLTVQFEKKKEKKKSLCLHGIPDAHSGAVE